MSTTTSTKPAFTGLLASKWATKPSESDARKSTAAPKVPRNTGLHKSRWSPEPTPASQPTSPTGPEPTKPEQIEEPAAELEDAREPLLELLPATTPQPYQKKSWADLVDEDDNDVSFDLAELNKENFAPQPATTIEATITKPKESEENTPPQLESGEQTTTTTTTDTAATATTTTSSTTSSSSTTTTTTTTKHAPASMLSSRWSDASYEIQGAQTRAEYRATHESTNNARRTTRTSGNRRRRAN